MIKAINHRLLALFGEALAHENAAMRERDAIWVTKEILKTPFRPLHL